MPIHLSLSDVSTFLACRYRWDLSSPNRQSLRHKSSPRLYLSLGSALHVGFEAAAKGLDFEIAAEAYLEEERERKIAEYEAEYGFKPWVQELKEFDEMAEFALDLLAQYFGHYSYDALALSGLSYIGVEVPYKIDISSELGMSTGSVYFIGTIDGLAEDEDGHIFTVEHKTYSAKPDVSDIQWHFQSMGYAVALEKLTGIPVSGGLYDGIAKKLISEPRVLNNGLLSTDKRTATTLARYLQAITRNGEKLTDPRFAEILSHLSELDRQGDTRFFYREKFFYNEEQKRTWWLDFLTVAKEMVNDPAIYRTIPYNGCGKSGSDCWFSDLCRSAHSGGDVDYIRDKRYQVGSYGTFEEVDGMEPIMVASVQELREALRSFGG